jgi:hypothetical protein
MGDLDEIFLYYNEPLVRSIDSCYPIFKVLNGEQTNKQRAEEAQNYFFKSIDDQMLIKIKKSLFDYRKSWQMLD